MKKMKIPIKKGDVTWVSGSVTELMPMILKLKKGKKKIILGAGFGCEDEPFCDATM